MQDPVAETRLGLRRIEPGGVPLLVAAASGTMAARAHRSPQRPAGGGDYSNLRFSPRKQLSTSKVGHLLRQELVQTGTLRFDGPPIGSPTGH